MKKNKTEKRQLWRLPLVASLFAGFIYVLVDLACGLMPVVDSVMFDAKLDFPISRYWDLPFILFLSVVIVHFIQEKILTKEKAYSLILWNLAVFVVAIIFNDFVGIGKMAFFAILLGALLGICFDKLKVAILNLSAVALLITISLGVPDAVFFCIFTLLIIAIVVACKLFERSKAARDILRWFDLFKEDATVNSPVVSNHKPIHNGFNTVRNKVIDLEQSPFIPEGFNIKRHVKGSNNFHFSPIEYELYVSPLQRNDVTGDDLLTDMIIKQRGYSATLLDWLLQNQTEIPAEFKLINTYFWGTIYEREGIEYVRLMFWDGQEFNSYMRMVSHRVPTSSSAVVERLDAD